jgi:peptidyl-dipeptidase Dcp
VYQIVPNGDDELIAIFIQDNFSRMYKSSGAWMSCQQIQSYYSSDGSKIIPIVLNNNNFAKGETATLLSFDDARTAFHEFGHGLHGMLSASRYEYLAGTSVLRDFVELPSQLYEHWLSTPEVLKKYARHYETDEPIPDKLLEKLFSAKNFNQGFETIEYTSSALIDQSLHQIANVDDIDIDKVEQSELSRLGMPKGIALRHRPTHFLHLFSGESYASAYYVYLWAEILDADAFECFQETGNVFDKSTADRVRKFIYSSGNTIDPREAFRQFRGRDAVIEPMLKKKGLLVME